MRVFPLEQELYSESSDAQYRGSNLFVTGAQTFPNLFIGWINVKDFADAHILVCDIPSGSGRHILVERAAHNSEVERILRELYPTLLLSDK
ncbi:hypothetical protein L6164_026017 [Bauhinia variegata]|uniref:Uncharacterized protein n=1 Tax=Bauhinia variegata TaxID=167791 RepID=A0ACB9M2R2_BAUVA|nr:hypothetical protein L6164_026017 [Bauhinia variegata]